jgi:hypothetical protein
MSSLRLFFVRHVLDDSPDKTTDQRFEIQLVDRYGRETARGWVDDSEKPLMIGTVEIPQAVIQAARRQRHGVGDFVDGNGNQVLPSHFGRYLTEPVEDVGEEM